ncbi:unnamed protein product [Nezara viridula]|uniref:Uncharacterized protein n=1 Tax=Nezara viridula TaxID=85310 RepID=A0A9P0E9X4_NEZVI|nr:unnamed protein product [Nezara viridula]
MSSVREEKRIEGMETREIISYHEAEFRLRREELPNANDSGRTHAEWNRSQN